MDGPAIAPGERKDETMTLIGVIWAALAPMLLVAAVAIIAILLRRRGWRQALALAAPAVLIPAAAIYAYDRAGFVRLCAEVGPPVVRATGKADGFLLTSGTANSFGMRYLHSDGFDWIEMKDVYRRAAYTRVSRRADGQIVETPIDAPSARYEVRETFEQRPHAGVSTTQVIDRETGAELARASNLTFDGGATKWVLGAWGVASCPNAMSDSDGFRAYYYLAKNTLR